MTRCRHRPFVISHGARRSVRNTLLHKSKMRNDVRVPGSGVVFWHASCNYRCVSSGNDSPTREAHHDASGHLLFVLPSVLRSKDTHPHPAGKLAGAGEESASRLQPLAKHPARSGRNLPVAEVRVGNPRQAGFHPGARVPHSLVARPVVAGSARSPRTPQARPSFLPHRMRDARSG